MKFRSVVQLCKVHSQDVNGDSKVLQIRTIFKRISFRLTEEVLYLLILLYVVLCGFTAFTWIYTQAN